MAERDRRVVSHETSILVSCPSDQTYKPIVDALVVAAVD
jgi:hypothetical protein